MINKTYCLFISGITVLGCLTSVPVWAQILPDTTLPESSLVAPLQDGKIEINRGTVRGSNLFHSFKEFSVPADIEASFNNADTITNILSRVTGGNISDIQGVIGAVGEANLFLINPAGIVFGQGASLNIGGSFISSTADSLVFSNGFEYSATAPQTPPLLTINAPIGLNFGANPEAITNKSIFDLNNLVGLRVPAEKTLSLIGGDVLIEGGFLTTEEGRIELGSVAGNSTVNIIPVAKGFDFAYEEAENFQDISLSGAAFVNSFGENTGDIQVQGKNITLIEGSEINIDNTSGQAANLHIVASNSVKLEQTPNDNFPTFIINNVLDDATGEKSKLTVETNRLEIQGGQIGTITYGSGRGVNLEIEATDIELKYNDVDALLLAQVETDATGKGGNISINTNKLTIKNGGQISTTTFGAGDAGDLLVNALESIELVGTIPKNNTTPESKIDNPSGLGADVAAETTATGNGGDLTVNTPSLIVRDGAQIGTTAQNSGNGGKLTINASDSILLTGFSPLAEFRGKGLSGIFVSVEPSIPAKSGAISPTTGSGGTLDLTTKKLIVEKGAVISADTFSVGESGNANINVDQLVVRDGSEIRAASLIGKDAPDPDSQRGAGGILNINASDSIEIIGTGEINGEQVDSSLVTLGESTGEAGNIAVNAGSVLLTDGGKIDAETISGEGGNIDLQITKDLTLQNNSFISARALEEANGGNLSIDARFVIAFSSQGNGNDIIATANRGQGGKIDINTQQVFNLTEGDAIDSEGNVLNNNTNDIDASSEIEGSDGTITITTLELDPAKGLIQLPANVIDASQQISQACTSQEGETDRFVAIGRGGLPLSPNEPLRGTAVVTDWVDEPTEIMKGKINERLAESSVDEYSPKIVEAQGWIINDRGNIELVSEASTDSVLSIDTCNK
ncbi:S-layer family protein [Myxosarcina sp. GI1]|uniref:two-partner secretion domain-containing protein n=1 Tax=Myxosarcina sp. GI1 TaxID=1541065 RepID=UPI00068E6173|nr:S-layer family protein [Myxosarcina sp. GI1]